MHAERCALLMLFALSLGLLSPQAGAQTLIVTVPAGTTPVALALNPATNKIFAVNQGSNNVTVIDGATNGIAATVTVGQSPVALAVNPVTNKIYVVNRKGNAAVTVVDGASYSTTAVVTGQAAPLAVAVNPVTNRIYVVNQDSSNVTVIDGSTNSVIATVAVGFHPRAVAINPATNKIYVANISDGSVTVIDGVSNSPTRIYTAGADPYAVAVNAETNRIYVANLGGTVSVIDGAHNSLIASVPVGVYPCALAVNPVSNLIYVTNYGDGTVSVIDGASNASTATVVVGDAPASVALDAVTNAIYVANFATGTVSAFHGGDRFVTAVPVRSNPNAVVLNPTTNKVYVANSGDGTVSVIAGSNSEPLQFIPITPCRLEDTRTQYGGGGPILGGTFQSFTIQGMDSCGDVIPASVAYSLNVTAIPAGPLRYLTVWAAGQDRPTVSTLNSPDGLVKSSAAIVPAGVGGAVSVYASDTTNVLLDINGYFTAVSKSTLAFYPIPPCRVVDTRWANGPLRGPFLQGGAPGRDFPMTSSGCRIPASALAYSLNFTAVPKGPLDDLTAWPAGQEQPGVSILSAMTGLVTANSAIVQAGLGGDIRVFVSNDSHVIIDINGYFGPKARGGLSLYATAPCRVLDTRDTTGAFRGKIGANRVVTCRWGI